MKELNLGIKIESEHKPTYNYLKEYLRRNKKLPPQKLFFKAIAQNHIDGDKHYYNKLTGGVKYNEN